MKTATKILYWTARIAFLVSFVLPVLDIGGPQKGQVLFTLYGWECAWDCIKAGPADPLFWYGFSNFPICLLLVSPTLVPPLGRLGTTALMNGLLILNLTVAFSTPGKVEPMLIGYWFWIGSFSLSAVVASMGLERTQQVVRQRDGGMRL